jgi:serine/threonine protein phosphatase PrpC
VAVVCDGVSTAPGSHLAAAAAAAAATDALTHALSGGPGGGTDDASGVPAAMRLAAAAAARAVAAVPADGPGMAPSCTFVAAVVTGPALTVGWLGDSRAYLLGADGPVLLTADDTVAAEAARAGLIPADAAETAYGAHTITRWLGPDSGHDVPHVVTAPLTGPGRVVVCSDGLWNYASAAENLAAHVAGLPPDASAADVARHLTAVALDAGGRDNITVVVVDIPGRA